MLSTRERIFTTLFILFFIAGTARYLVLEAREETRGLRHITGPLILTPALFLGGGFEGEKTRDRNLSTAWVEGFPPGARKTPRTAPPSALPDPGTLYLLAELGLTHFPGDPPLLNPPRELYLWSGHQASPEKFHHFARPRHIRLLFFRQELVDVDREFRLPGLPVFWGEKDLELPDRPGRIRIPLNFLPTPPESPAFPAGIDRIWLRLEVLDTYPGDPGESRMAITEIDYAGERQEHRAVSPGPPEDRTP